MPYPCASMLNLHAIKAISLDLDDTLWPVAPTLAQAELVLRNWLQAHAPAAAQHWQQPGAPAALRAEVQARHPDRLHDYSFLRLEMIRQALRKAGERENLAEPAFEAFFEARQQVQLFADSAPALDWLAQKYPVFSLSNGNADLVRTGVAHWFAGAISARQFGVAKPDRRIFHEVARRAGVQPAELLHIGDDAHLDARAALQAGVQAIWLNREDKPWQPNCPQPVTIRSLTELKPLLTPAHQ